MEACIVHYTAICGWVLKCILRYVKDGLYLEKNPWLKKCA